MRQAIVLFQVIWFVSARDAVDVGTSYSQGKIILRLFYQSFFASDTLL
jgi:hypothetical protein